MKCKSRQGEWLASFCLHSEFRIGSIPHWFHPCSSVARIFLLHLLNRQVTEIAFVSGAVCFFLGLQIL